MAARKAAKRRLEASKNSLKQVQFLSPYHAGQI
jgi:hypothetical protein